MSSLIADLRYAWRRVLGDSGTAIVAILSVALGVGASTAIFGAVDRILLSALPYPGAERIVVLTDRDQNGAPLEVAYGNYLEIAQRSRSFEALAVEDRWQPAFSGTGEPEQLEVDLVSAGYFRVFGVGPLLGRDFTEADDVFGAPRVVVVTAAFANRRFGNADAVLNRTISLEGNDYTVIGVMPDAFENVFGAGAEVWAPRRYRAQAPPFQGPEWGHNLRMVGRLRPGVTLEQAQQEILGIGRSPAAEFPRPPWASLEHGLVLESLHASITNDVRPALLAILGAVLLLLAIACANVTNLLLARALARRRELAMRAALGAGRGRLARQLFTESALLAIIGGALGLGIAALGSRAFVALAPAGLPRLEGLHFDARLFVIAFSITALVAVVVGLVPVLRVREVSSSAELQTGARATAFFDGTSLRRTSMNVDDLEFWRTNSTTLSHLAVTAREGRTLATEDGSVQLYGSSVSPALFAMRGVPPLLGRGLLPDEERPDADVVVLAEATWRQYFGSDPGIVGRTIELDGRAYTVVGVMPPAFGDEAFWTPFLALPPAPGRIAFLAATARLRDGVSLEAASTEANVLGLQLRGVEPTPGTAPRFEVVRELDQRTARVAPALRVLVVSVAAVLAIVCTNVANLLLVRGTRRQQEIAIRRSLGATRSRIARQVFTESLVLALFAGLAAAVFAAGGVSLLKAMATVQLPTRSSLATVILPRVDEIAFDPVVLAFIAGLSLVTGIVFGLLPALRLSRYGERGHAAASQISAVGRSSRLGYVLATVQFAFAMALLIGAGLLLHSFLRLAAVDPGFDPRGVLSFELVVPGDATAERKLEVAEELVARLAVHPAVTSAGFTDIAPLSPGLIMIAGSFIPEGTSEAELREEERTQTVPQRTQGRHASADYLRALGARLVEGSWTGEPDAGLTAVVSRPYAERYFRGRSAVGARLIDPNRIVTVVGVVDDIHIGGLDGAAERVVFLDPRQILTWRRSLQSLPPNADRAFMTLGGSSIAFAVRTTGDPLTIMTDLRAIARDIDPRLAIDAAIPMERIVSALMARPRFYAVLLSVFGAIAGFIAVIGIYGVLSYVVGQRTKEIGVRMALGAQRAAVLALVLRQGIAIVAVGIAFGIAGAAALTRYLEGMLFGLTTLDATTFAVVAAVFAAVAMVAVYLPARRATVIDPLVALRHE